MVQAKSTAKRARSSAFAPRDAPLAVVGRGQTRLDPYIAQVARAIRELDESQRAAVWQLVRTFRDG